MGVYIKGMKMPKDGNWNEIRIYPDGTCAIPNWQGDCTFIKEAKAIPVLDHGRLIDADTLKDSIHCDDTDEQKILSTKKLHCELNQWIDERPTIIPEDKEET